MPQKQQAMTPQQRTLLSARLQAMRQAQAQRFRAQQSQGTQNLATQKWMIEKLLQERARKQSQAAQEQSRQDTSQRFQMTQQAQYERERRTRQDAWDKMLAQEQAGRARERDRLDRVAQDRGEKALAKMEAYDAAGLKDMSGKFKAFVQNTGRNQRIDSRSRWNAIADYAERLEKEHQIETDAAKKTLRDTSLGYEKAKASVAGWIADPRSKTFGANVDASMKALEADPNLKDLEKMQRGIQYVAQQTAQLKTETEAKAREQAKHNEDLKSLYTDLMKRKYASGLHDLTYPRADGTQVPFRELTPTEQQAILAKQYRTLFPDAVMPWEQTGQPTKDVFTPTSPAASNVGASAPRQVPTTTSVPAPATPVPPETAPTSAISGENVTGDAGLPPTQGATPVVAAPTPPVSISPPAQTGSTFTDSERAAKIARLREIAADPKNPALQKKAQDALSQLLVAQ